MAAQLLKKFFFLFVLINLATSFLARADTLQKTLSKYSKAQSILAEIKKIDEKIVLGTVTESAGTLKYSKNKIYISQEGDKKVELFYKDKTLVLVEYPDADFDKNGNRKVTTVKKSIPPMIESLLSLFSNPKNFNKDFKKISEKKLEDNLLELQLQSKLKNLKSFTLVLNSKNNQIVKVSFVDDVDTKTTINFDKIKLNEKIKKETFQFTKLKTDEEMTE